MASVVLRSGALLAIAAAFVFAPGCSGDDSSGSNSSGLGGTSGSGGSGTSGTGNGGTGTAGTGGNGGIAGGGGSIGGNGGTLSDLCGGPCQCSNGIDDDGDGDVDGLDGECTGPADNEEDTFATGIPGDNEDPFWQDCFFDGNSGAGDDQCRYHTECITGERPLTDPSCTPSQDCIDFCQARTPNGCDCFGCCTVTADSGMTYNVMLAATCSLDNIEDETACPRCMPTELCGNTCGTCELCLGKEVSDLPPECTPEAGPPMYTCDNNEQVCSETVPCPASYYCQLGCCLPFIQ